LSPPRGFNCICDFGEANVFESGKGPAQAGIDEAESPGRAVSGDQVTSTPRTLAQAFQRWRGAGRISGKEVNHCYTSVSAVLADRWLKKTEPARAGRLLVLGGGNPLQLRGEVSHQGVKKFWIAPG
jgi:hypothetical protein